MRLTCPRVTGIIALFIIALIATVPAFADAGIDTIGIVTTGNGETPLVNPTFSFTDPTPFIFVRTSEKNIVTELKWYLNYGQTGEELLGSISFTPPANRKV